MPSGRGTYLSAVFQGPEDSMTQDAQHHNPHIAVIRLLPWELTSLWSVQPPQGWFHTGRPKEVRSGVRFVDVSYTQHGAKTERSVASVDSLRTCVSFLRLGRYRDTSPQSESQPSSLQSVQRNPLMPLVGGIGLLLAQGALCRSSYTHTPGSAEPAAGQREALADCYSTAIVRCIRIITHLPVSSASFVYGAIAPRGLLLALRGWFCCVCVSHAQHHIQSFATTNSSLLKTATFFLGFGKAGRGAYSDDPKPDLW